MPISTTTVRTYQQFVSRIRRELEEDPNSSLGSMWEDEDILDWTNDAIYDFSTRVRSDFDEVYTDIVAGQNSYELPGRTTEVIRASYNGSLLARVKDAVMVAAMLDETQQGTPVRYSATNDTIYLHPTPASNVSEGLRFWRRYIADEITDIASVQEMPWQSFYDDVLGYYVKARAWEKTGDKDLIQMNDELYNRGVDDAVFEQAVNSTGDYFWEPAVVW